MRNVISVIDGAAGSCGKAKVIGELVTLENIQVGAAVANCMPNAGHTFVDEHGKAYVFRNIPVSIINPKTELFIGPGSAIDMDVFIDEISRVKHLLKGRKIYVHELVPIIEQRHKDYERKNIKTGSTFKGCGAVTQEKVMRDPNLKLFKDLKDLKSFEDFVVCCSEDEWVERLYKHLDNPSEYVIVEIPQGCDLGLNSMNYPNVTSRDISTAQFLDYSKISPERLLQTIMVIRPFPIRISNITTTGDYICSGSYGNGRELTWSEINVASQFGWYPYEGILDDFKTDDDYSFNESVIEYLADCPEMYLKQLFKNNYENVDPDAITLLQAVELERLYYKAKGQKCYESSLIELPLTTCKDEPTCIYDLSEQTTVTKMERRVFDLDIQRLKSNCRYNTPSSLYLNFFEQLSYEHKGKSGKYNDMWFDKPLRNYLEWLESETNTQISVLGTGPKNGERIIRGQLVRKL